MGLGRGRGEGEGRDSSFSLLLGNRILMALPNLYIAGFKRRKMGKFIPDRKNTIIKIFDKPIRKI